MDYKTKGYEDLELSTQILIKAALRRGITVEVLDRKDNFLRLEKDGKVEAVKQATKTSADSYISSLIMENKSVTKRILAENGIRTPSGRMFTDKPTALAAVGELASVMTFARVFTASGAYRWVSAIA